MCAMSLSVGSYRHNASKVVCFANRRASQIEFPLPSVLARRPTSQTGILSSSRMQGCHETQGALRH